MKTDIVVSAATRESRGKNEARRLRVKGLAPAIVYGAGKDPVAVSVSPKEVVRILHSGSGQNTIFNLDVTDIENTPVMIAAWQNDPVKGNLLHVDLKRIDLSKRIIVKVPVHVTGDPKGVKIQGGLLELVTRDVEIECLPDEIPEHYTVSVAELMIGQSVRASEIPLEGSVKLLSPPESVLAHVVALRAEAVPEAAAAEPGAAVAAEPEVIKKGKKEEEAAADDKKKK
jgi:large subunit ribosomal protein L25